MSWALFSHPTQSREETCCQYGIFLDRLATGCFWGEMYTRAWLFSILIKCCYRCLCFRGRFAPLCRPWGKYSSWKPSPSNQVRAGDTLHRLYVIRLIRSMHAQALQVGMCGEICDPVYSNKICLFLSFQSWCRCLRTSGDQALALQPYSGGLTLKTKHAVANFNLHSSRFYLISLLSVRTTIAVVTTVPLKAHISTFDFVSFVKAVNMTLLCLATDRKQSIVFM